MGRWTCMFCKGLRFWLFPQQEGSPAERLLLLYQVAGLLKQLFPYPVRIWLDFFLDLWIPVVSLGFFVCEPNPEASSNRGTREAFFLFLFVKQYTYIQTQVIVWQKYASVFAQQYLTLLLTNTHLMSEKKGRWKIREVIAHGWCQCFEQAEEL